jgi:hypothetical protein
LQRSDILREVEANQRTAAELSKVIERERYHALMRYVEKRDPPLAKRFKRALKPVMRQVKQLAEEGNTELAKRYIAWKLRRLELNKDFRKERKEQNGPNDLIVLQYYSTFLTTLYYLPGKDYDLEREEYINKIAKSFDLEVPTKKLRKLAAMRRKEEIARNLTCRKLRIPLTTMFQKVISRAKKIRATKASTL